MTARQTGRQAAMNGALAVAVLVVVLLLLVLTPTLELGEAVRFLLAYSIVVAVVTYLRWRHDRTDAGSDGNR